MYIKNRRRNGKRELFGGDGDGRSDKADNDKAYRVERLIG